MFCRTISLTLLVLLASAIAVADDKAESSKLIKHQITGLFAKDREKDLRDVFEKQLRSGVGTFSNTGDYIIDQTWNNFDVEAQLY